jgi:hypothetical protein
MAPSGALRQAPRAVVRTYNALPLPPSRAPDSRNADKKLASATWAISSSPNGTRPGSKSKNARLLSATIRCLNARAIGIERHQFPGPHPSATCFFEPGVRALTRGKQPCLDEFTALPNDLMVHHCEELVLANARPDGIPHRRNRRLRACHADLQAPDFLRRFYCAYCQNFTLAVSMAEGSVSESHMPLAGSPAMGWRIGSLKSTSSTRSGSNTTIDTIGLHIFKRKPRCNGMSSYVQNFAISVPYSSQRRCLALRIDAGVCPKY